MAADPTSRDELLLNALIDGELTPAERAAAADRLASDRDFARAHATLMRLKASVMEVGDGADPIELPSLRKDGRRLAMLAGSAALAASLTAVAVFAVAVRYTSTEEPAIPAHAHALRPHVVQAAFHQSPIVPDLAPAGLNLANLVLRKGGDAPVLVITYLGPRGCRLELRVQQADAAAPADLGSRRHRWRVGELAYELVAYGMPGDRFAAVAEAAERATRSRRLPLESERRLQQARISAPPCLA